MHEVTVSQVASYIEAIAPLGLQESYDNSGLLVGNRQMKVTGILIALDATPSLIDEALKLGANLIVTHHPIIFSGLKRLTGSSLTEQVVLAAIKNDLALYCAHTNLDSAWDGVSHRMAAALELANVQVLEPTPDSLLKLVTFAPHSHAAAVRAALFAAGAGHIGNYDQCSFNLEGTGTFRGNEDSNPHVGQPGKPHIEPETRIEVVLPRIATKSVLKALGEAHPYEEVAYDLYPLANTNPRTGLGVIGNLPQPMDAAQFMQKVRTAFGIPYVRHSQMPATEIQRVALCGGSGASLMGRAVALGAHAFVTADAKYHNFFDAQNQILLVDAGHFETELFAVDIFYELLTKKLPNFAIHKSVIKSNPINYY